LQGDHQVDREQEVLMELDVRVGLPGVDLDRAAEGDARGLGLAERQLVAGQAAQRDPGGDAPGRVALEGREGPQVAAAGVDVALLVEQPAPAQRRRAGPQRRARALAELEDRAVELLELAARALGVALDQRELDGEAAQGVASGVAARLLAGAGEARGEQGPDIAGHAHRGAVTKDLEVAGGGDVGGRGVDDHAGGRRRGVVGAGREGEREQARGAAAPTTCPGGQMGDDGRGGGARVSSHSASARA
jgi:hypothetical protein